MRKNAELETSLGTLKLQNEVQLPNSECTIVLNSLKYISLIRKWEAAYILHDGLVVTYNLKLDKIA